MPFTIGLFSFIALLVDHMVGNTATVYYLFYLGIMDAPTMLAGWLAFAFVYPVERLLATIILTLITIAASEAIVQTGLELPVAPWESRESLELTPEEVENG
jgi:hypothetical protein